MEVGIILKGSVKTTCELRLNLMRRRKSGRLQILSQIQWTTSRDGVSVYRDSSRFAPVALPPAKKAFP